MGAYSKGEHALICILTGIFDPCVEKWTVWEAKVKAGRCFGSCCPSPGSDAGAWTTGEKEVMGNGRDVGTVGKPPYQVVVGDCETM